MIDSSTSHLYISIAALCVAIAGWIYTLLSSPMATLPGPYFTTFTDIPLKWTMVKGRKPLWVDDLHRRYGPIVRISPYEASVQDTAAVRQIYQVKGEFLKADFYDKLASGIVNVFSTRDVDIHKHQRRLLSGEMAESGLVKHLPVIETKVRMAIERMREEMQQRKTTDVFHWFLSMATDVIGELSFGESFKMLETGEKNQYMRDLKGVAAAGGIRVTFPFLIKVARYITIPVISNAYENRQRTLEYAEQSLQRHQRIVQEQGDDAKPTLLSKLYNKAGEGDDALTSTELRDTATSYIVAGSDTTANTLTYIIWMVCKHPEIKAKLLRELGTLPDGFEYADVKNLSYLNQVVEETLRMYPAAPAGLPRTVPPGGATLAGHYIPAGYTVSAQAWTMHRHPEVFPDPLKYEPSRWENPTQAMKDTFVPFGGGSRVCLGLHLARMELRLATARFFSTFPNAKASSREGFKDEDMNPDMFFLLTPNKHRCLIEAY
ncbi:putative Cytochrome protein [Seiridium cardinale]